MSFDPVWSPESQILLLGSWPSPKSWQQGFYYGHPRNRFWPLMARLTGSPLPETIPEKKQLLLHNRIALWDVLQSCTIQGAADSSIRDPVPNDLTPILQNAPIQAVFCNGSKAAQLYERYLLPATGIPAVRLPSTSPANAACSAEQLYQQWQFALTKYLSESGQF